MKTKTQRTLSELWLLSDDEKNLIIRAIRATSTGGHPYPEMATIGGFTISFAVQSIQKYLKKCEPGYRPAMESVLFALQTELQNG